jgi:hypothetical protein
MNFIGRFGLAVIAALSMATVFHFQRSASRGSGKDVLISLDSSDLTIGLHTSGHYSIIRKSPSWRFEGDIGQRLTGISQRAGQDEVGPFTTVSFQWTQQGKKSGEIRLYTERPLVLFTLTCQSAQPVTPEPFPALKAPITLHTFGYSDINFAPPTFTEPDGGSPWMWFDDSAHAAIFSPASNFMTASVYRDTDGYVDSGWEDKLENLPEGFRHRTLLAFGNSIGETWKTWGHALTDLSGKTRPNNNADLSLKYFGYWTSAGTGYYYNFDPDKGYGGTLLALRDRMKSLGIPLGYMQLDSWWYVKTNTSADGSRGLPVKNAVLPVSTWNCYGGLTDYVPHKDIFPDGLSAFQKQLGLPLITHNRWVDVNSPYRQRYFVSGIAAIDPKWWTHIAGYLQSNGAVTYEQDWLSVIYSRSPQLQSMPTVADAFMDNMAKSTSERGITMQYCMTSPRFYLQGSKYDNLTSVRVSDDRFSPKRWENFLYTSQLASSLGEWPWADACRSGETANLILANLSAGPVGVGDVISEINAANIQKVIRSDGVIVKPDTSIVPMDATYLADGSGMRSPMVAAAYTDHGTLRTAYVFAFPRASGESSLRFRPADLGLNGQAWVYDVAAGMGRLVPDGSTYFGSFANPTPLQGWSYFIVAPVTRNGIAFLGDAGKFVSNSHQRIAWMNEGSGGLSVSVSFAENEGAVELHGFSQDAPVATASAGRCEPMRFDPATHEFRVVVAPNAGAHNAVILLSTVMDEPTLALTHSR